MNALNIYKQQKPLFREYSPQAGFQTNKVKQFTVKRNGKCESLAIPELKLDCVIKIKDKKRKKYDGISGRQRLEIMYPG